ncbi:PREDICTED: MD-2-related lipid-recognition protein-like [Wasmannia auropunctata]|uniref:MD-2-related lipid-recognition protein-like n=1 Tax=Wasmannia auropunctata TaxID=64793 RepID=UPI0005ED4A3F|nr:PREDICTED: MD-2-related lipid-recognition protein-like [Wasmannia auropunctata]
MAPPPSPRIHRSAYLRYVWTDPHVDLLSLGYELPSKMNRNFALATAAVLILALSAAYAEVVHFTSCPSSSEENTECTIHEVRVDPCREAEEQKPCSIKKGRNASISFDYTTQFSGNVSSRAYWASEIVDLPFLGMPLDACRTSTICPVTPGQKQSYSVFLPISKKFPARTYDLKWKLWNEQDQGCCFMFQIKLVK